jgi:hypothetical protein
VNAGPGSSRGRLGPRIESGSAGEDAEGLTLDQMGEFVRAARQAGAPGGARPSGAVVAGRVTRLFIYPPMAETQAAR